MTYREQVDQALATFSTWPKDQQDAYLRMLDDLRAKCAEVQSGVHCTGHVDYDWCDGACDD